jgi:cytochrome c-type biogenesis protein CcmH
VTTFVLIAAAMLAAACASVLVPLLKRRHEVSIDRESSNLAILRDQRAELEADLGNGVVSPEQYEITRGELDRRVLEETRRLEPDAGETPRRSGAWTAAGIAALFPIAAVALYLVLGTPAALSPDAARAAAAAQGDDHATSPEEIESMIGQVKQKLAQDPSNIDGWVVLARTYYVMQRPAEAAAAFERAVALAPNDADLIADWADTLGVAQGRSLDGKPEELVQRALKANPSQWKANALAGTIAFNRKQYAKAVEYWERARANVDPGSPIAQSIAGSLEEARQLGGMPPAAAAPATPPPTAAAPAMTPPAPVVAPSPRDVAAGKAGASGAAASVGRVGGTVKLVPTLAAGVSPEDAVYIFARPADGSRMPLALVKRQVKDLPFAFTLDDSMAMSPSAKLSDHAEVIVGARVSRSGSAMPQSGDLEGLSAPVKLGSTGLALQIDRRLP